jgi:hypothetical protein
MAKRFFYVCVGALALVLAYHLGANRAEGQSAMIEGANISDDYGDATAVVGGTLRVVHGLYGGNSLPAGPIPPVPAVGRVIATSAPHGAPFSIILDNGDVYDYITYDPNLGDISVWRLRGNLAAGPTPVQPTTFGAIKAKYRR